MKTQKSAPEIVEERKKIIDYALTEYLCGRSTRQKFAGVCRLLGRIPEGDALDDDDPSWHNSIVVHIEAAKTRARKHLTEIKDQKPQ